MMELNQPQCLPHDKEALLDDTVNNIGIQTDIVKCRCHCHCQDPNLIIKFEDAQIQTVETDFYDSCSLISVEDWKPPEGSSMTVADLVRNAVEEAEFQSDYIYDNNTKLYYNAKLGYYYDPERKLFYEPHSGTYYSYDEDSKTYQFYCHVDPTKYENEAVKKQNSIHFERSDSSKNKIIESDRKLFKTSKKKQKKKTVKNGKYSKQIIAHEEVIADKSSQILSNGKYSLSLLPSTSVSNTSEEEVEERSHCQPEIPGNDTTLIKKEQGPYINMLYQGSASAFNGGVLFITPNGATFGRETCNDFCLKDSSVSRMHAVIIYNQGTLSYYICDLGSENGTWINEQRISEKKVKSQPYILKHDDCLFFGKCKFLIHIHSCNESCDICNAAQVKPHSIYMRKSILEPILNDSKESEEARFSLNQELKSDVEMVVAELVQLVADKVEDHFDYIFDEYSQLYYSAKSGFYYDPERCLFYEPYSGSYYSFDEQNKSYHLYSQTEPSHNENKEITIEDKVCSETILYKERCDKNSRKHHNESDDLYKIPKKRKGKARNNFKQSKSFACFVEQCKIDKNYEHLAEENSPLLTQISDDSNSTLEEGEIEESSDSQTDTLVSSPAMITNDEDSAHCWPPCIRVIVQESKKLIPGSLLLITCNGVTVGREDYNTFCVPDSSVSKSHATITYDEEKEQYVISDLGSQNGTWVNEKRLSESKEVSQPYPLTHGDHLILGNCKFLLHIHTGVETCDECEPGQVQAKLNAQKEKSKEPLLIMTKEEKEHERKWQLKKIKKKFGLENMAFETDQKSDLKKYGYEDLAHQRRKTVGSDNPYEKDEVPSSLSQSLSEHNKGYKLLQKMGWCEGQSLGKKQDGLLEPIPLEVREGRSGLGSEKSVHLPADPRRKKWLKAQKRYKQLDTH